MALEVTGFFDEETFTVSYVLSDSSTKQCAVLDSVLDYDPDSGRTSTASADALIDYIESQGFSNQWILETHVHADHLTAAPYLKEKIGGKTAIGGHVTLVQETFAKIFNVGDGFACDGSQFDVLFEDGEVFSIGSVEGRALHTPGHTPACMSYVFEGAVFVGDTLFMPDYGSARCDFPGGDARELYRSVQKLFSLPPETRMFLCHDYKAPGRDVYCWETSVGAQRQNNIHLHDGIDEDDFVDMRTARDKTLDMPRLILPSVQVNMRAGHLPPPEDNGIAYLKLPLNVF